MTEDEAFIRAIVDNPGDDTPRLVYAEWLDDRDDPRGTYLRAEREWGRAWREGRPPGDATELRALAAELDPVWVARISRAPMGVCFETKLFVHDHASPASGAELYAFESEFGIVLPPEYGAFLLNYNGGWLSTPGEEYFPESDDFFGDIEGVTETARRVCVDCAENDPRCGLVVVGGTAGASGMNLLIGVGLVNEPPGPFYRGVYSIAAGTEEPWIEDGEFVEDEDWSQHKVADSLQELFAEWEQEAIWRANKN